MRFDWDDKKNQLNIRKHGISFDLVVYSERGDTLRIISARKATTIEEEAYYERL